MVVGNSGSGKTTIALTLAERLDVPCLEMDAVIHADRWNSTRDDEFRRIVTGFTGQEHCGVDDNYTSRGVQGVEWSKPHTLVWVDPPKQTVVSRVIRRTLKRIILREKLWNGLHEPLSQPLERDPDDNIIVWVWTRFDRVREKYKEP